MKSRISFVAALVIALLVAWILFVAASRSVHAAEECLCPNSALSADPRLGGGDWNVIITNKTSHTRYNMRATIVVTSTGAPSYEIPVVISKISSHSTLTEAAELVGYLKIFGKGAIRVQWLDENGTACASTKKGLNVVYLMKVTSN